ncbi:MAG: hypothetical protein K2X93_05960 [Candidatus Obscuribacterales bacterium]|nr:hypothetical protein [Candidatus Obscuribacterales bacterium]
MKLATIGSTFTAILATCFALHGQSHAQQDKGKVTRVLSQTTIIQAGAVPSAQGQKPFGSHLEPILKAVGASDEQKKTISEIVQDFKGRIEPMRKKHDELRDEFLSSLTSGKSDETIISTQAEFNRVHNDLSAQYLALRLKVQQVLTPDQNEKYKVYRDKQGWK